MIIRKLSDKKLNVVLIQGSPRDKDTCPGMISKTHKIVDYIVDKWSTFINFKVIDLSVNLDKKSIVQPCKGCVSSAGGMHCHFPCVPSSERVQTEFGYEYINNVQKNDILSTGKVIKQWMTSPMEDIYEIILTDGRKLRLTNNHMIKVLSKERFRNKKTNWKYFRKEEWKELKDIKIGDFIPTIPLGGKFKEKTEFNNEYFLLSGLFWGDGTSVDDSLLIYYDDKTDHDSGESIKEKLIFPISDLQHNAKGIIRNDSVNNSEIKKINYGRKNGRKILYEMGFKKTYPAIDRRLPEILFNCSEEELCLFFEGWFSTDGSVSSNSLIISLSNISYDCLRDAQLLLAKIGIKSSVSDCKHLKTIVNGKETPRASQLSISGYSNIKIFNDKIGFINNKSQKLLNLLSKSTKKTVNKSAKVKSIKYISREPVYDITVEKTHEFIAEGILVHNCDCYFKGDEKHPDLLHELDVYELLQSCDAFIVLSPIHWHSVSSQVKALFDRLVCINLTLSRDDAKKILGDDIKNPNVTGKLHKSGKYNHLLRNHLEGKVAAFYIHGDNGANDYNDRNLPDSYSDVMNDGFQNNPESTISPFIMQLKYSGVYVPDELIQAFYINTGVDYFTANLTLKKNKEFYDRADNLMNNLLSYFEKE